MHRVSTEAQYSRAGLSAKSMKAGSAPVHKNRTEDGGTKREAQLEIAPARAPEMEPRLIRSQSQLPVACLSEHEQRQICDSLLRTSKEQNREAATRVTTSTSRLVFISGTFYRGKRAADPRRTADNHYSSGLPAMPSQSPFAVHPKAAASGLVRLNLSPHRDILAQARGTEGSIL